MAVYVEGTKYGETRIALELFKVLSPYPGLFRTVPIFDASFQSGNHLLQSLFFFKGLKDGFLGNEGLANKFLFGDAFDGGVFE